MRLNQLAADLCQRIVPAVERLRIALHRDPSGSRIVDCGVKAAGGLEAGRLLAEVCLGGLGEVTFVTLGGTSGTVPGVMVRTDHPLAACMYAQYAGWRVSTGGYFAMGSGPMRALAAKEPLFQKFGFHAEEPLAVGVLESSRLPTSEVCEYLAQACHVSPQDLIVLVARTASQAGGVQVVARSVETAMHKLFELGFDLTRVEAGIGTAPLPPVAGNDLTAMGRTNDAILYGGEVTLWVRGDDAELASLGVQIPSGASPSHGLPFTEIFEQNDRDFYRIDPSLFGPAVVTLVNLDSGRSTRFGRCVPEVIERSFSS